MDASNLQKKQEIDQVMTQYSLKMAELKERRTRTIQAFLEKVRQRRIQEIQASLYKNGIS